MSWFDNVKTSLKIFALTTPLAPLVATSEVVEVVAEKHAESKRIESLQGIVDEALGAYNFELNPGKKVALEEWEFKELIALSEKKAQNAGILNYTPLDVVKAIKSRNYTIKPPADGKPSKVFLWAGVGGVVLLIYRYWETSAGQRRR